MAIVFKTPKSALNTTTKTIQNLGNGECPPCPDCPEVNLETADVNYIENGEYTLTPEGDGFSKVDITVNVDTETPYNEGYAAGETAGIATGKAEGIAEQKAKLTSTTITENGTTTREDGWNSVTVNVQPNLINTASFTSNGTYSPQGYDGYREVTVSVIPDLQAKTVNPSTSQQIVAPDQGKDGLSTVTVNAVTSAIDRNIISENIKNGVTILGVTGNVEEANFEPDKTFLGDVAGKYMVTPERDYNGFNEVQVTVDSNPIGSFWNPFDVADSQWMEDLYTKLNRGGIFEESDLCFTMTVDSGRIDRETGYYVAEDGAGNVFNIKPYLENPDYDPENPDPNVPELIFPENFDLAGLNIQVTVIDGIQDKVTVNKDETDPRSPVYTVEISECDLAGINWNSDKESWHYYWDGTLSGDIEASTRNLSLSTNIAQTMSIASPEAWEIELDEPTKTRSTKGLLKVAAQPTLEIDQMSGDAGVFTLNVLSTKDQNTGFTVKGLDSGNQLHIDVNSMGNYFTIESLEDNNEITWDSYDDGHILEYSLDDGATWERTTLIEDNGRYIWSETINNGDIIKFRGNNAYYAYGTNSGTPNLYNGCVFKSTGTFNVYGDIRTLLNANNALNATYQTNYTFAGLFKDSKVVSATLLLPNIVSKYCYDEMFMNCEELLDSPELPATALSDGCYYNMFNGCSSMPFMPDLPATYLAESCYYQMFALSGVSELRNLPADYLQNKCYDRMFYNCNNLTSLDEFVLPATHLATYCYQYMFAQCQNLVSVNKNMLPATSLKTACYQNMFDHCVSLVASPELPATNLAQYCYNNMFYFCSALVSAPELPATVLTKGCYTTMFGDCDSLVIAPILPAATLTNGCYNQMFIYCHKLNSVTCLATDISASNAVASWLDGVSAEGTFYKNPEMTSWPIDSGSGVPTGWTLKDYSE